jgi:N6-adenosine-specific RNA methylase IME4
VTSTPSELVCLEDALQLLRKARSLQELVTFHDRAQAIARYRQQADVSSSIENEAAQIKLYAERRLGEFLREANLAKSSPSKKHLRKSDRSHHATGLTYLKDYGISKSRSSRAQDLARLPQDVFDGYISDAVESGKQPTLVGALQLAKQFKASSAAQLPENMPSGFVTNLQTLLDDDRKFSTIYADPPWRHDNQASRASASNHYPTMSLEEICEQPIAELAAKNCHLHLWATSPLLPEALKVMEAWSFSYKACFIWAKPQIGLGNYWRISHELLLLGVRGKLAFQDHSQRSWLEADRTKHSEKPEQVRELIEKISPSPYLELHGRKPPANSGWTVFGNQINEEVPE